MRNSLLTNRLALVIATLFTSRAFGGSIDRDIAVKACTLAESPPDGSNHFREIQSRHDYQSDRHIAPKGKGKSHRYFHN